MAIETSTAFLQSYSEHNVSSHSTSISFNTQTYTLYYYKLSIASRMAGYTYALRRNPKDPSNEIVISDEEFIDITTGEQCTEHYLCEINPLGTVPVIEHNDNQTTIPSSLAITNFLAEQYPSLIPSSHASEITSLLDGLHDINLFTLMFSEKPEVPRAAKAGLEEILKSGVSENYAERRFGGRLRKRIAALEPEFVAATVDKAEKWLSRIESLVKTSNTKWLFGEETTALDAHVAVFASTMQADHVGRGRMIPETVKMFARRATEGREWVDFEGR